VSHRDKETYEAEDAQGTGQRLLEFFTTEVSLANYARGGRAINGFKEDGFWASILENGNPGDVVLIQFGINDRSDVPDAEDFKNYLRDYTNEAREKQLIPIFVTPIARGNSSDGVFSRNYVKYCDAKIEIGAEMDVPVIDLQTEMVDWFNEIGADRVQPDIMRDNIHPGSLGAYHSARIIADWFSKSNVVPMRDYVITEKLDPNVPPTEDGWNPRDNYIPTPP
jgi:lysophospholipase L1-like esterase